MLSRLCLVAMIGLCLLSPAHALTLVPGNYKMEWVISKDNIEGQTGQVVMIASKVPPKMAVKYRNMASKGFRVGNSGNWTVILDESKGTGRGYDTAYVFGARPADGVFDASRATKVSLVQRESCLMSDPDNDPSTDLTFGDAANRVTRSANFALWVMSGPPGDVETYLRLIVGGQWRGKISTDAGEMDIVPVDDDLDGIYGEPTRLGPKETYPEEGDRVQLSRPCLLRRYAARSMQMAKAMMLDGKLYCIQVSKTGETIDVKQYTGDVSKFTADAKSPSGKSLTIRQMDLAGDNGYFELNNSAAEIPAGAYRPGSVTLEAAADGNAGVLEICVDCKRTVNVTAGQPAVLKLGGALSVAISPTETSLRGNRGKQLDVEVAFKLGEDAVSSLSGGKNSSPVITITNSKGKVLKTGKAEFG